MAQSSGPKNLKAVIKDAEELQKRSNEFYDQIIGQIDDLFGSGSADEADIETIGRVLNEKHKKWFRSEAVELRSHSIVGQNTEAKDFELGRGQGLVEDFPLSTEAERLELRRFTRNIRGRNYKHILRLVKYLNELPKDCPRIQVKNIVEDLIKCQFNINLVKVRHGTDLNKVPFFKAYRELLEEYRQLQNELNDEYRPELWKRLKECVEKRKNFLEWHSYEGREEDLIRYANDNYYLDRNEIKTQMYKEGYQDDWNRCSLELEKAADDLLKRLKKVKPQKGMMPAVIGQFDEYVEPILQQTVLAEDPRMMLPDSIDGYPVIEDFELKDLDEMKRYAKECADSERMSKERLVEQRRYKRRLREAQVGGKTVPEKMKKMKLIIKYLILHQHRMNISLPIDGLMSFKDYEKWPKQQAIKAYRPVLRQYLALRQALQNALEEAVRKGFDEEVAQDMREQWEKCIDDRLEFVEDHCQYGLTEAQAIRYANYDMYLDPTVRDRRKVQSRSQFGERLLDTKDPCSVENLNDLLKAAKQIRTDLQQKLSTESENQEFIPLIGATIRELKTAKKKKKKEEKKEKKGKKEKKESRLVPIGDTTEDTSEYQALLTELSVRFKKLYDQIEARRAQVPDNQMSPVYIKLLHRLVKIPTIYVRLKKRVIGVEVARDEDTRDYCDYDYNTLFHYRAILDEFIEEWDSSSVENAGLVYQLRHLRTRVSAEMLERMRSKKRQLKAKAKQMYQDYLWARISQLGDSILDNSADVPTDRLDTDCVDRLHELVRLQTIYDMLIAGHINDREARHQEERDYRNYDYNDLFNFRATVRRYIGSLGSDPTKDAGLRYHLEHLQSKVYWQMLSLQYQKDSLTETIAIPEPSGTTASTQPSKRPTGTAIPSGTTASTQPSKRPTGTAIPSGTTASTQPSKRPTGTAIPSGTTASTQPSKRPTGTAIPGSSTQLSELEVQVNHLVAVTAAENLRNLSDQSLDTYWGQTQNILRQINERAQSDTRVFNTGAHLKVDLINISIAIRGEQSRRNGTTLRIQTRAERK